MVELRFSEEEKEIIEQLKTLPDKITEAERKLLAINRKITNLQENMRGLEMSFKTSIDNETEKYTLKDGTEKERKKYSNQDARDAELYNRKENSEDYQSLKEEYESKKSDLKTVEVDINDLKRRFKAYRGIAYFLGRERI